MNTFPSGHGHEREDQCEDSTGLDHTEDHQGVGKTLSGFSVGNAAAGSGTALEAAQQLDCRFAGLDVNPEAVAVALSRVKPKDLTVI